MTPLERRAKVELLGFEDRSGAGGSRWGGAGGSEDGIEAEGMVDPNGAEGVGGF